ncbi:MAG: tRNA pseudouridine(55) synthase TruB [Chloroflexaceae bacterium]
MILHGFLNIDKPAGLTSHDVVARIRRLAGRSARVGHAGTLDPMATGVLPVALGHATRLIEYLAGAHKGYVGLVRLGVTTTTDDGEGEVLATRPVPPLDAAAIEAAVARLRGDILQIPPAYAALHYQGRRLYELARAGVPPQLPPRPVVIYRLDWERAGPDMLRIVVECGKGAYMRSLARDIGAALGCGAHLATLRRTFVGPFHLDTALPLDTLGAGLEQLVAALLPPETAIADWPAVTLDATQARRVTNGMPVYLPALSSEWARAHSPDGALLAVLRHTGDHWRPEKVFV